MPTKYVVLPGVLTKAESDELKDYVESILQQKGTSLLVHTHTLSNRPDAWDAKGYIERVLAISSGHFQAAIHPTPLDRVGFYVRKINSGGSVSPTVEKDNSRDAQVHEINRKVAILVLNDEYEGGSTVFVNHGETIKPKAGDLILYDVDEINKVGVEEVTSGSKVEIIYMYMEVIPKTRFDEFPMPPMESDSDRF